MEGIAQQTEAGLSDPVSSSPFGSWLIIYIRISNHKEPITTFNGVTSSHLSRVRTLLATSTSEIGTEHFVSGDCKLELAAGCSKRPAENRGGEGTVQVSCSKRSKMDREERMEVEFRQLEAAASSVNCAEFQSVPSPLLYFTLTSC